jgi:hypothetical protein
MGGLYFMFALLLSGTSLVAEGKATPFNLVVLAYASMLAFTGSVHIIIGILK